MTVFLSPASHADTRKPILIVAAGRTFPELRTTLGDFDDWIARGLGDGAVQQRLSAREAEAYPDPAQLAGVVVSGSHAMVTDREPWSERLAAWLQRCVAQQTPVLGICYGHQLLAHALGGHVDRLPEGPEVGTRSIALTEAAAHDALLGGLPATFGAQLVHYQSVLQLPADAVLLARSAQEPHQAFRVGTCAWGVQFHPEFPAEAMAGYVDRMQDSLADGAALRAAVRGTPEAASLLRRFAALATQRSACTQRV